MKFLRRFSLFLLVAALLVGVMPIALAAPASFSDVRSTDWFAGAVSYVQENGLMGGVGGNRFAPNDPTTRGMLMTVLARNAGAQTDGSTPWYQAGMDWAMENGISDGTNPTGNITREQLVTMLWRYSGAPTVGAGQAFADQSSISSYAAEAVAWARENSIISGRPGNRFDPKASATRAEVATILRNYLWQRQDVDEPAQPSGSKTLVVFFSASGNTADVAGYLADALGADTFELVPQEPYSSDDLNWTVDGSRVNREHDDEALRDIALTEDSVENWDEYDTVFIGYPIWWGIAAWPVNNFVKNNDFTGKTVIPFCTSTSSGIGQSGELLSQMAGTGEWQSGERFRSGASQRDVAEWAAGLGLQ